MTPRYYTTDQACAILGSISRSTLGDMVSAGVIERPLRGRYTVRSVEAFVEDGRTWQAIAKEKKDAARKVRARNGKTPKRARGAGKSDAAAKATPSATLTDRGRVLSFER